MEQAIRNFHTQFAWRPRVENADALLREGEPRRFERIVVGGMGGSHLSAGLLEGWKPELDVVIHRDYGLPALADGNERLWIASSYSGNTEETIDFAAAARRRGYPLATVSVGGKLLEFAQKHALPHVVIPDTHIQPRSALGFSLRALAALTGDKTLQRKLQKLASVLKPDALEKQGKALAAELRGAVPVICSSERNRALAYNWKIKMNETGKIPAFYNVFPELNHNEMTGFDAIKTTGGLSRKFHFIFLTDSADYPQNKKRVAVTKKLYEDRRFSVTEVPIAGKDRLVGMFSSLLTADWTALHLSRFYGTEAAQVPMVEEFKKLITLT